GYLGTFTPTLTHDATGGSTGTVGWTFSVSDQAVDFLATGQTLTQTYTVQVADNNGGFTNQDVTLTITDITDAFKIAPGEVLDLKSLPNNTLTSPLIENDGTIVASTNNPNFIITGNITGTGLISISNNTTLTIEGAVGSGQTVQFAIGQGVPPVLVLTDPTEFQATISGFQGKDQIDLTNINFATVVKTPTVNFDPVANITTVVITDGLHTDTLKLVGDYRPPGHTFNFSSDGSTGTLVVDPPASTTATDATTTTDALTTTTGALTTTTDVSTTGASTATTSSTTTDAT